MPLRSLASTLCVAATMGLFVPTLSAVEEGKLLIWINGDKGYRGLAEVGEKFEEELGIPVTVEVPEGATDKFQQAAQAAKGPDIFFWAHDRVGEWADAGLLRPIKVDPEFKQLFNEKAWDALTHRGQIWGYPVALESVGLIYNKKMVSSPPAQVSDIGALNDETTSKFNAKAILWDYQNTYFTWGILASGGGYVFGEAEDGSYNPGDVGVNTPGSIAGLGEVVGLIDDGIMPKGASYSVMEARMNNNEVAMMISGPWAWSNLRKSGIDFGVAPVPGVNGKPGKPFIGVLGALINRSSPNKSIAVEFLEHYALTDEGLAMVDNDVPLGVPARLSFYEKLAADNPLIEATNVNVANGEIMPNVAEMGRFWSAMEAALQLATNGQVTPERALNDAANNMKN